MDKDRILAIIDTMLDADDISNSHKVSLKIIRQEIDSKNSKLSTKEAMDISLRITQIFSNFMRFFD